MNLLIPNLGTTSLKYQLLAMPGGKVLGSGKQERVSDYAAAIRGIDTGGAAIDAVAFKAVHAGPHYRGTYLVDEGVLAALEEFLPAAPAHNAIYLTALKAFREAMPGVPLVTAFETEFHATMPEFAARYGVPGSWHDEFGVRKYGFHGASHQYVSERAPELLGVERAGMRLISCHLGGSSSICAIGSGRSVDTTMGFSPQSGLENATRHGDLDVFAVLYMMRRRGWQVEDIYRELTQTGGLAGLSGIAGGDVRDLEAAAEQGNREASLALDVFTYEVRKTIGAYAAAMGGVDAIAFTGGIGENSARLRSSCCRGLEFLGVQLDAERNESGSGDRVVSAGRIAVLALRTNEELVVARRAYAILTK
ncbi:MAG: acetate/propionate family kinase [Bryobacterales bacterium]|nr:acetate/propionate family kinase [Bryobacterales bacterium]